MAGHSDKRSKMLGCGCATLLLVGLPFLFVNLLFPGPYTTALPMSFDSQEWKDVTGHWEDERRCAMLIDLEYRIGLEGRSRVEVLAMLGAPSPPYSDPTRSIWELCPSFLDIWVLEIRWEDDRVAEVWVRDT